MSNKGNTITVYSIGKTKTGFGHWKITVNFEINGQNRSESFTTTNSQAIDDWDEETENHPETGANQIVGNYFSYHTEFPSLNVIFKV